MDGRTQRLDDLADFSDPAFSARVSRFVGIDLPMGISTERPRPELVDPGPGICLLEERIARFVYRRARLD